MRALVCKNWLLFQFKSVYTYIYPVQLISPPVISLRYLTVNTGLVHHVVCLFTPSPASAGTHCAYPHRDGQAEVAWL